MSDQRHELLAAIEAGDHTALRKSPWEPVWRALATGWAPKQGCTLRELRPYVEWLGNHDADVVLDAVRECAGEWRPGPAEVLAALRRARGESSDARQRVDVGRGRDRSSTPEAERAAFEAHQAGEPECSCGWHADGWRIDQRGVLRCRHCSGLEAGQVAYGGGNEMAQAA